MRGGDGGGIRRAIQGAIDPANRANVRRRGRAIHPPGGTGPERTRPMMRRSGAKIFTLREDECDEIVLEPQ